MKKLILFILTLSLMTGTTPLVFSLPEDGQVESGTATFEHPIDPNTGQADPSTLNIIVADNTVINFQSFNIAQNESVNFIQPSSTSQVLSRVVGSGESTIYGSLTANGMLFLVNPNGIRFGPTANVNVNNLVASTLDISTNNFINQNYVFEHADNAKYSQLFNEGVITCTSIALIGSSVNNKGIITARAGIVHLASGDKTTVSIDQRGFIQVEINEETSGKVFDLNGVVVKDAVANSGTIEGVQVIMSAKTADDVFENAVNQNGVVKATGMVEVNGVIRIVADNKVRVSGTMEASGGSIDISSTASIEVKSDLNAKGALDIKANTDITVEADIYNADNTIRLYADYDNDGIGSFSQVSGTIEAAGTGDVYIDGSGVMTLNGIIATEYGAIKIGTRKAPDSIEGFPQYVHRKGDINIIEKYDENGTKVLKTDREDVLRYNSQQGIALEATAGAVKDATNTPIVANNIKIKANNMEVQTQAPKVEFYKNSGDLYISASRVDNDVVTVDGEGFRVTYLKSADVTFRSDNGIDTDAAVILTAYNLKLIGARFGTYQTPVITDTLNLTIVKIDGDIDIRESLGIGTSIMLRGPPENGFGQIIYPKNAALKLEALGGSIFVLSNSAPIISESLSLSAYLNIGTPENPVYFIANSLAEIISYNGSICLDSLDTGINVRGDVTAYGDINIYSTTGAIDIRGVTIYSKAGSVNLEQTKGNINVYGTVKAPEGTVRLWTCGNIDLRQGTVISKLGGFIYNPVDEIAVSWIGGTGNWNVGANWTGGNVPNTNSYNVTIDQLNAVVTMDIGAGVTIGQLTIGSTNTSSLTLAGALTLDDGDVTVSSPGSLTIGAFGTLNAAGYAINIAGNWSNSGTFNHGNNMVTFNGTNQLISGSTIFYSLTCVTPGTTLVFDSGSLTTITNTLTIEGAPGNNVTLKSSVSGVENRFNIYINAVSDAQGNPYLEYITVDGSDALGPIVPIPAHNTNISGDTNLGWDADRYWVGGTGNWSDAANHWAATSGGLPGAGNLPVAGDSVFFDSNSGSGTVTINSAGVSVLDLNETSTNITIATSTNGITVTGNMTVNKTISGATAVTFSGTGKTITGGDTGTISAPLTMGADTIVFVNTGNTFTISGVISGNYNLAKTGAGTLTLSGSNSFSGGLTIKAGTLLVSVSATPNALGANGNIVTIGDTSGTSSATLTLASTTYPQPFATASGTSGVLTINATGNAVFLSGAVTLNNNLTISSANGGGLIISGGITGTGNVVTSTTGTGTISITTTSINNIGTITNSGSGTGATGISAVIGLNVTGVIQNSATSGLGLSGANTFTGGLTIKAGIVTGSVSTSAFGGSGTGTITIGNTSGSADAALRASISPIANPIIVASGSSGTLSITNTVNATFSGAITLNNNLTISAASTLTLSGGITGTGNVIISTTNTSTTTLSTVSINNIGTITNSGAGSGTTTISSVIGTNVTGVIQNSATSQLTLSGVNTFTGGLTIKAGTVLGTTSASAFGGSGTGAITIGDTAGSADAVLKSNGSINHANPITVAAGSGGILSIMNGTTTTFSGAVTLNNNLTLNSSSFGTLILSGGITGTGNIITNAGTGAITIQTTTANMIGTITNSGTGSGTTTISAVIGTNVTGVIQNSATSQLTLSGANTFTSGLTIKAGTVQAETSNSAFGGSGTGTITIGDTSGTANASLKGNTGTALTFANPITVVAGSSGTLSITSANSTADSTFSGAITLNNNLTISAIGLVFTGGISGTGNLAINETSTGTITLSTTSINNTGTITNSGSGSGTVTISSVIGSNVTGVVQNSATSQLTLSGANTFTSGLTIKAGTVSLTTSTSAGGGSGTGTITIGDTSGNADATLKGNGLLSFANPITVASGSSGILNISSAGSGGTTYSGAIDLGNNITLTASGTNLMITGGITGTGNIIISGTGSNNVILSTVTINSTGTITNSGSGAGTTTISSVIGSNVTGLTQNSATSKLVLSGNNSSISGDVTISAGTLEISGTTALSLTGNWANSGIFTANSSTVTFNAGSGTQTLNSGGSSFYGLTHSGVGILQLITNDLTVTSALANSAGTFDLNGKNLTTTGATFTNSATLKLQGDETIGTVNPTLNAGSTVEYTATSGIRDIKNWTYTNATVKINGTGGTFTLPVALSCAGLNIAAGTFQQGTSTINVSGNLSIASGAVFTKSSNSSALTLTGTGNISDANATTNDLGVVVTSGTGTTTMTNNLKVTSLSIGDGTTFNLGTGSYTLNITGTGTPLTTNASGTFNGGTGSTVLYTGTTTATNIANVAYVNLTLTPTAATTYSLLNHTTLTGNLTISTNATLDATTNNYNLTLTGNWSNSGTFTARLGTVTFNGASSSTISGSTTFYDLKCIIAGKTLNFESGSTQTVAGTLTLTGASGNLILLRRSGGAGLDQWSIKPQGTVSVSYVDVANSNNTGTDQIYADDSVNSGNNTRWSYSAYVPPQNPLPVQSSVNNSPTFKQGESILFRSPSFQQPLMMGFGLVPIGPGMAPMPTFMPGHPLPHVPQRMAPSSLDTHTTVTAETFIGATSEINLAEPVSFEEVSSEASLSVPVSKSAFEGATSVSVLSEEGKIDVELHIGEKD